MTTKQILLNLARRSRRISSSLSAHRHLSQCNPCFSTCCSVSPSEIIAPPPNVTIYDRLADSESLKSKIENPDPRFLQHSSPVIVDHTNILSFPETRVTTLPNGLRVATESNMASNTATVGVWINAGSRHESDDEQTNGTAHFLEHMLLNGTNSRPHSDLQEEIENMGGHLNSRISREKTSYCFKVMDKDVPQALDILADILQNSTFQKSIVNRERNFILSELEERERHADKVIFDHLHENAFQYSPLGRTVLGPALNIMTINRCHLRNYISTQYTASRMVIAAAGNVKHDEIVEQVKKLFTKLSNDPTTTSQLAAKEPAIFTGSEVRIIDDDVPLAHFAVAFSGASWTDPDSIALKVMQSMLGSWNKNTRGGKHIGSELAKRVGINEIAESMMAFNYNYKDTGLFGVCATAKPDCLNDLADAIMYEISNLSYRVSEEDVTCARNQLKSSILLHLDGTTPVADDIGSQLLNFGRRIPFAELFARIDAVDVSTVKRVANRFISDKDIAISAMGPIQGLPDYNWFRRRSTRSVTRRLGMAEIPMA